MKYMEMFTLAVMWKWFYYAPNTLKEMYDRQIKLAAKKGDTSIKQVSTGSGFRVQGSGFRVCQAGIPCVFQGRQVGSVVSPNRPRIYR
jgi:hypothetical protein